MEYYFTIWKDGILTHLFTDLEVAFKKAKEGGYSLIRLRVTEEGGVHYMSIYEPVKRGLL
jgi:hypothetical protein